MPRASHVGHFRQALTAAGFKVLGAPDHPIAVGSRLQPRSMLARSRDLHAARREQPVLLGDARLASEFADLMLEEGASCSRPAD